MKTLDYDSMLDATGLPCPLPLLRAKKVLVDMVSGDVLKVISDDINSVADFRVFARTTGNRILDNYRDDNSYYFYIEKK